MSTDRIVVITHPDCVRHDTGPGHPERPERLAVIMDMLDNDLPDIDICEAVMGSAEQLALAHGQGYIDRVKAAVPPSGLSHEIDDDTVLSAGSWDAAMRAVGAACMGVDLVASGDMDAVFCATRPPGHHAEPEKAMGFCLFANAYIAARWAREKHGVKKIAIVDFDVHHGNGTAAMIYRDKLDGIFFVSSHQFPFWPGTGDPDVDDDAGGLILDVPLAAGTSSDGFRAAYLNSILPRLRDYAPELIVISAGFDAHKDDPIGGLNLDEEDYRWVTEQLRAICPKIVSILEGGYDLNALTNSVRAHLEALSAG